MSIATITELWRMSATELAETIQSNRFRVKKSSMRTSGASRR
jgi:hypothetical protein